MTNQIIKKPNRRNGLISKTVGNDTPKEFLFIDTESHIKMIDKDTIQWPLRLGVCIYVQLDKQLNVKKRTVTTFFTVDDFIETIKSYCKRNTTLYIVGHNIKFDIMVMNLPMIFGEINWYHEFPIINDRLFVWRVKANTSRLVFIDTANYGVISVSQLGKDFGYDKLEVDFTAVTDEQLITYCIRDTEIVERFMLEYIRFINTNGLGTFTISLASQALRGWRTRFMKKAYHIHSHDMVLSMERDAYHGGRVECFNLGFMTDGPYYYLDVNSMYPYVMSTSKVPTKLLMFTLEYDITNLKQAIKRYYCIADVLIQTDKIAYPVLKDGKLIFPIGEYRTTLQHNELKYALEHNHVKKVYSLAFYEFAVIFKDYVDFFYKLRAEAKASNNASWNFISKLFLNSLYGKTGQMGIIQTITPGKHQQIIERSYTHHIGTDNYGVETNWFGTMIKEKKIGEASYSNPAIAGAITANARMLLYSYMEKAGFKNVLYVDTDSLIVNTTGYTNLSDEINNSELGKLKLETESNIMLINGPKDYQFAEIDRHKGIPNSSQQIERNKWRYLQFPGMIGWLNKGGNLPPEGKYIEKSRRSNYNKGVVNPVNGGVTPIILGSEPHPFVIDD